MPHIVKTYYQFFMFNMITTNHCTITIHSNGFLWGHFVMTCSQSGEHPKKIISKFAHIQDMKAKIFKHFFIYVGYLL